MQKPREIQQKRPATRNKQAVSKDVGRDRMFEKSAVRVLGLLYLGPSIDYNRRRSSASAIILSDSLAQMKADATSITPDQH